MPTNDMTQSTMTSKLRKFLKETLKDNQKYKVASLYEAFTEAHGSDLISQKDFAMLLRLEVIHDNGMLRRNSHGIYELRTEPQDKGLSFPRRKSILEEISLDGDPLLEGVYLKDGQIDLYKIFDDLRVLTVAYNKAISDVEKQVHTTEGQTAIRNLHHSMMKEFDMLFTGATALMAFQEDLMDDQYKTEWHRVCEAYCKKVGAELLFVNEGDFGCEMPDGEFAHIYADELQAILEAEDNQHSLKLTQ